MRVNCLDHTGTSSLVYIQLLTVRVRNALYLCMFCTSVRTVITVSATTGSGTKFSTVSKFVDL